jgi:hypothetical protein
MAVSPNLEEIGEDDRIAGKQPHSRVELARYVLVTVGLPDI